MTANAKIERKRIRRTKAEMDFIRIEIYDTLQADNPQSLRQLYYQLTVKGVIEKTEAEYKTLARLTSEMRKSGDLPFSWFSDSTRWMRKPRTYTDKEEMLQISMQTYRRAIWIDQPKYVEIWLEKDALSGVIGDVTAEFDVPLMVCRGYPSLSFLDKATEIIKSKEKPTHIFYFGDRDPTGVNIPQVIEKHFKKYAPKADITFEIVAVTEQQIRDLKLPTRPTKKSDSRAKKFKGESVELDAIPARVLKKIVRDCIESCIDERILRTTREIERLERESFIGAY